MLSHTIVDSPLGELRLVARDGTLSGVYMPNHRPAPRGPVFANRVPVAHGFGEAARQLDEFFSGRRERFDLETDAQGTPFQRRVWERLAAIPYGSTVSYRVIAEHLGSAGLARAVGAAGARNPLSVIVPCHRVISSGGALTGYAGGLDNKQWLLDLEAGTRA